MISDLSLWAHSIENLLSWTASSLFSIILLRFLCHFVGCSGPGLNISLTFYLVTVPLPLVERWAESRATATYSHWPPHSNWHRNNCVDKIIFPKYSKVFQSVSNCWYIWQVSVEEECWLYSSAPPTSDAHYQSQSQSDYTPNNPHILASQDRCCSHSQSQHSEIIIRLCFAVLPTCLIKPPHRRRTVQFFSLWIKTMK